ncbi:MAG: hypothetical protein AAGE01_22830 [Pseudomonadota bacterium]
MSASNIAFSALSPFQYNYVFGVWIGDTGIQPPSATTQGDTYWILVVDRCSLKPVYSEYWDQPDTAPTIPDEYNDPNYMLIVVTWALTTPNVPTGAFYDFLVDNGAGGGLDAIVQANSQAGCGVFSGVCYILVGQLGEGSPSGYIGIEDYAVIGAEGGIYLPMQLVPATVGDQTIYTPTRLV